MGIRAFLRKNERFLYFVALGLMGALIVFATVTAASHNILHDRYAAINTIVDIIMLVFLCVLFGFSFSKGRYATRSMQYFGFLIVYVFAAVFISSLANALYSSPGNAEKLTVLESVSHIADACFYLVLWNYQKKFYDDTKMVKVITLLLSCVSAIYATLMILNIFVPVAFVITKRGVYDSNFTDHLSIPAELICILLLYVSIIFSKIDLKKKLSFASCVLAPMIFMILSLLSSIFGWDLRLVSLADVALVLPLYIIFFNIYIERENEIIKSEKEQMRLQIAVAISQIRPHFLYNSLSVIAALCEEDPTLAATATNTFADYLRANMNFADKNDPITFSEELNHIKNYVWLEKLRFQDRIDVQYDIRCTDFPVPPLSIQPLVENAIKHGVCKAKGGGTVTIRSFEEKGRYVVTVEDTGVGFDPDKVATDDRKHIGIGSSRFRIEEMLGGTLTIESAKGKGTKVTVIIPKEYKGV